MKNHGRREKHSLMVKIVFSNVVYVMLPVITAVSFLSLYLISNITEVKKSFSQYVSKKVETSVISMVNDINNISISIISDSQIRKFLAASSNVGSTEYLSLYNNAKDSLLKLYLQNQYIADIYISAENNKRLNCDSAKGISITDDEIDKMRDSNGGWFWSNNISGQIAMYRVIRDFQDSYHHIAYMKIAINSSAFLKIFDSNRLSSVLSFALFDSGGSMIVSNMGNNTDLVKALVSSNASYLTDDRQSSISYNGSDYYLTPSYSSALKGYLVTFAEDQTKLYRNTMIAIIFGAVMIFLCISLMQIRYYKKQLLGPILELGDLMGSVENKDFNVQFNSEASSEIKTLADKFNSMAKKLHVLYNEVYTNKILLQEAEFKHLQSEINPHFLCNALDSVHWMVELGQKENASKMVEMLSQLFRLSIQRNSGALIPLGEELNHANLYMGIQQMRFNNKIFYTTDVENGLNDVYVMKFILQPILENAVTHGLSLAGGLGEISLSIYKQDDPEDFLIYYIYDSGSKADEGKINRILSMEPDERKDNVGLALQNINGRLKIKFGEKYGIIFRKMPDTGSVFIVKQPFIIKGDQKDNA